MFEIGQLTRLPLGYVGENGTRTISIDMKAWLDEYPGALIMIQVIRPVDHYKYPAAYTKTDGVIHWTIDGSEVMYAGKGLAQIALYNPDTKQEYKSRVVGTIVAESLDGFNDILLEETDPASKWVNQVLEAAESAEASKNDAANSKEEAAAAIAIVATQKNEALIAIQNEGAAQVVSVNDAGTQQAQFVEAKGEEVLGMIPEDYAELSKNVAALTEDIDRNTAPPIIPTATGEIVSVSDSENRPLAGLRLYGKTTQNGTPTPNSPVPLVNAGGGGITTRTRGKNLLTLTVDDQNSYGVDVTKTDDGAIVLNGTAAAAALLKIGECNIAYGGYVLSAKGNKSPKSGSVTLLCYDRNGAMRDIAINEHTTSTTFDGYGATNVQVWWAEGTSFDNLRVYPAVEYGNTATGYETYKDGGTLYANIPDGLPGIPVTSGGNYVDEHGQQWICDVRDYGRGVYVQRIGEAIFDGSEDEQWFLQKTIDNTYRLCTNILSNACADHPVSDAASILCNQFVAGSAVHTYVETKTNCIAIQGNGESMLFVYHEDFNTSDMNPWLAHLSRSPMKVYYKLATPIETPIPADELAAFRAMTSQYPNTTVYNDAGAGMAVDYIADTRNYIDQKLAAIAAATL